MCILQRKMLDEVRSNAAQIDTVSSSVRLCHHLNQLKRRETKKSILIEHVKMACTGGNMPGI